MLQYKLGQARGAVADALHERARRRGFVHAVAASQAMVDPELDLPAFSPDVPLEAVLDYRMEHSDELDEVRRLLPRGQARRVRAPGRGKRVLDGVGPGVDAASTGLALALAPTPLLPVSIGLAALGFRRERRGPGE
jgi:hypothetical protein